MLDQSSLQQFSDDNVLDSRLNKQKENQSIFSHQHPRHKLLPLALKLPVTDDNYVRRIGLLLQSKLRILKREFVLYVSFYRSLINIYETKVI